MGKRLALHRWALTLSVVSLCVFFALAATAAPRTYNVTEKMTFVNEGLGVCTKLRVVVSLFRDWDPYIDVVSESIAPSSYTVFTDEFGNRYAEITVENLAKGARVPVTLGWRIAVGEVAFDLSHCATSALPPNVQRYLQSETYIESDNPSIKSQASLLSAGKSTACDTVQAIYDYVIATVKYAGYIPEIRGALSAYRNKRGDCTEFALLMTALCRAAGIPARALEGVTNDAGDEVHTWMEAYLPGLGWVPFDPTWGRLAGNRTKYLGAMPASHIPQVIGVNLNVLSGYSYYAYNYWWGATSTSVSVTGYDWSVK